MSVRLLITLLLLCAGGLSHAAEQSAPPALALWESWVLRDQIRQPCPRIAQQPEQRRCIWPGQLTINIHPQGGDFSQQWQVMAPSWLILPGDNQHWPQAVTLNNKAATLLDFKGQPAIHVAAGHYTVEGQWRWQKTPQYLKVATDTALIKLSNKGRETKANIDGQGRLWLRSQSAATQQKNLENTVKLVVFRALNDVIPMQLETELRLSIAGKPREITLGQLLPANAEALSFDSPLPARIEPDGRLKIQARAGQWVIRLRARYLDQTRQFTMKKMDKAWPTQEIWSFRAAPQLRGVKLSGLPAIDPSQIDIPPRFANLPTFLMTPGASLELIEQYRGDATPAANRLNLQRTLWLDFDGSGAISKDIIRGTMSHGWRLHASPELQLGRIVANGSPQLVTQMAGETGAGIEIRQSQVDIEAINRIDSLANISANGWLHDFDKVELTLQLPPGWQLWHAAGPDSVQQSWLALWDLWDLFICLLIIVALLRTLSWRWALVGVATLALTYHESGSPLVSWVILVAALALLKVLPSGKFKQVTTSAAYLVLSALLIIILAFAVQQIRSGLYPQLEQNRAINASHYSYSQAPASLAKKEMNKDRGKALQRTMDSAVAPMLEEREIPKRYRPSDNVQTGPGEPDWRWQEVHISWSGPVNVGEPLTLYLSPPLLTRLLKFVQVGLVALLFYGLAGPLLREHRLFVGQQKTSLPPGITSYWLAALLLLTGLGLPSPQVQAESPVQSPALSQSFPPEKLLRELKAELLKAPLCAPRCAALQKVDISVDQQHLRLQFTASAATPLAFPLPLDKSWQVQSISVDNKPATLARHKGKLWVQLQAGVHDVRLSGLAHGDNINIPFALPPHYTSASAPGWRIHGLNKGLVSGGSVQLEKELKQLAADTLLPAPIKPFVQVERQLDADIDWQLITTVRRIAPQQGSINLRIPLLEGESVVSQNMLIEDRHAVVSLKARQAQLQWRSVLKPDTELSLMAPQTTDWIERWSVVASPRWHITGAGIPVLKTPATHQQVNQRWQPWPGETLKLHAVEPQPVPGPNTTIESIALDYTPGKRSADLELELQIRTSLGGDYRFKQPPGGELQSMIIDGVEQTRPKEQEYVVIPLHPGLQTIDLKWQLPSGVALRTLTPSVELPTPANNINLKIHLPQGRWPLLLSGPDIGPAMLYWGVLAVIIAIAIALGACVQRLHLSIPLKTWHWLLLAIGMSTVNMVGSLPVVLWFFAMEARRRYNPASVSALFNLMQIALIGLSAVALMSLFFTIPQSLLSTPNMQISGNGSSGYIYQWYQDHSSDSLPSAWVFSLPLWVFRLAMLLWSMWLVFALLKWIKWGWQCLSSGKLWDNPPPRKKAAKKSAQQDNAKEDTNKS
ncbi:MAG: hypothetical protein KBT88_14985 [Gammaproteobacteria bacterium]|nr:hypothetical protein [Gammaproteobacteria bacterium]MBQ0841084.1 hypothetical protein [Gammaproteobacteria bacterium]